MSDIIDEQERNKELNLKLIRRSGTGRRIGILRLDYLFSVLVPCLMPIYFNGYSIWNHIDIIVGFTFYGITGNVLNDVIDMRDPDDEETRYRTEGYHWKELLIVAISGFLFGSMMFVRTITEHIINGLILATIVGMVILYCFKKNIPLVSQILLGVSHILLPYIMINIDANASPIMGPNEWFTMFSFFFYALAGQIVHEIIDGDSISKFRPKIQQILVFISSGLAVLVSFITLFLTQNIYVIPFIIIPIGAIYTFRRPTRSTKGVKDVGIILGNMILFYFIILIIRNMLV